MSSSYRNRKWWGLSSVGVIVLVVLLLTGWEIQIKPSQEAHAHEALLAIMYFDNMTEGAEQSRLGEIVTDLLMTDLAESGYLTVVSEQRIYDILRQLGYEGVKDVDESIAFRVAQEAGARYMVTGSLIQNEPYVVIASQLVSVRTSGVLVSQRVDGDSEDDLFAVVDRLSAQIRRDLQLPSEAAHEYDPPLRDITTASTEAYRHYIQGRELYQQYREREAAEQFAAAVEIDSTFAMAYLGLYRTGYLRDSAIALAYRYRHRANSIQQRYIEASYAGHQYDFDRATEIWRDLVTEFPGEKDALYHLGATYALCRQYDSAVDCLRQALVIDARYRQAYEQLTEVYSLMGDIESAIWAVNKYIEISPDEPMPFRTLARLQARRGDTEGAVASFRRSIQLGPSFASVMCELADLFVLLQRYEEADSLYEVLITSGYSYVRKARSRVYRNQGRFLEAVAQDKEAVAWMKTNSTSRYSVAWGNLFIAAVYALLMNQPDSAQVYAGQAYDAMREFDPQVNDVQNMMGAMSVNLALLGRMEEADSIIAVMREALEAAPLPQLERYAYFRGYVEREKGHLDSAITYFEQAASVMPRFPERY